jgi:hypothetical protein
MRFIPKTEEEVKRTFEKGDYRFKVIYAEEKNAKNGSPMIHIKMNVFHNVIPGKTTIVDSYLTSNPNFEFLIRHFAYSIGLGECYESGALEAHHCQDREGIVRLGIETDTSGKYPDKNRVFDFIVDKNRETVFPVNQSSHLPANGKEELNDGIPF